MIHIKKQQIATNNKPKMDILVKVILITMLSCFLTLLFFDYSDSQAELDMKSPVNCLTINQQQPVTYLCNTCFKVPQQNKYKQNVKFSSKNKFMIVGLKRIARPMFDCRQWLQTVDYQSELSRQSAQRNSLKLQQFIIKGLNVRLNQHNQNLQILTSQPASFDVKALANVQQATSTLQYPNYIAFYYTSIKQSRPIQSFYSNQTNKQTINHILKIITISCFLAILYVFHCGSSKGAWQNYKQHIFSFIGVLGMLIWIIVGDIQQQSAWVSLYCKVIFFTLSFGVIFGAGKWLFFGIITLSYFLLFQLTEGNRFYQIIFECLLMVILVLKINSVSKAQKFFLASDSNKRIYLVIVTLILVSVSCGPYFIQNKLVKQISQFFVKYLSIITFLMSIKSMDEHNYEKLFKGQKIISPTLIYNPSSTASSTSMVEESQLHQKTQSERSRK